MTTPTIAKAERPGKPVELTPGTSLDSPVLPTGTLVVEEPASNGPSAPTLDASEALQPSPAVSQGPEEGATEGAAIEPSSILEAAKRGAPSDWHILPAENGITALNRHHNYTFEGSIAEFNEFLRGQ